LADDHPLIVLGLKNAIKELLPEAIFYEAIDGGQAYNLLRMNEDIDLCIIDVNMPTLNGFSVLEKAYNELKHSTKAIILTLHKELSYWEKAKKLGAKAYLLKENALTELESCLTEVIQNRYFLSPAIEDMLRNSTSHNVYVDKLDGLERQLLKLIELGKTPKEISEIMVLSSKSISKYIHKICNKLEIPPSNNSLENWVYTHHNQLPH